jgi:DNA-binding beta-propeller fold protein YncE
MGVAVSPKGNIIAVVDGMNHSLQLFDKHGNFLRKCSTFIMDHDEVNKGQENESEDENEEAEYPRSICFDKSGEFLYVSDYNSNSLLRLNVGLTSMERLPWYFCILMGPRGLTVDSSGNILLCDSKNNCIRVVEPSGNMQAIIGGHDQLKSPCDVTVLQNNQIAVLDGRGIVTIY